MPRIAKLFSQKSHAEALPQLLNLIRRGAKCSVPELCRILRSTSPAEAKALERSWRKWTDVRSGAVTMPNIKTLEVIIHVARSKGWIGTKLPAGLQALVEAVELYGLEVRERWRLKVARHMSHAVDEMAAATYSKTKSFDETVEVVLVACCDMLVKNIPLWFDADDLSSADKLKITLDAGLKYMWHQLAQTLNLMRIQQQKNKEYFRFIASDEMINDVLENGVDSEAPGRLGSNWRKL